MAMRSCRAASPLYGRIAMRPLVLGTHAMTMPSCRAESPLYGRIATRPLVLGTGAQGSAVHLFLRCPLYKRSQGNDFFRAGKRSLLFDIDSNSEQSRLHSSMILPYLYFMRWLQFFLWYISCLASGCVAQPPVDKPNERISFKEFANDTLVSWETTTAFWENNLCVRESTFKGLVGHQPDTILKWHAYNDSGERLRTETYESQMQMLPFQVPASWSELMYNWQDDKILYTTTYRPTLVVTRSTTSYQNNVIAKTITVQEDTITRTFHDSIWLDTQKRIIKQVQWDQSERVLLITNNYSRGAGDTLVVQKNRWERGQSVFASSKFRVMNQDTIIVYEKNTTPNSPVDEAFWIYNEQGKQTDFVGKQNGRVTGHYKLAYDENGMLKQHNHYDANGKLDKEENYHWVITPSCTEVFHFAEGIQHYSKTIKTSLSDGSESIIYVADPVTDAKSLMSNAPPVDALRKAHWVLYDAESNVILQCNYDDQGRLTYERVLTFFRE
jgi:hypothetical protein